MFGNKFYFNNIPLFNKFDLEKTGIQISPFAHFNLLFTPEFPLKVRNEQIEQNEKLEKYNPLHLSAGIGVSVITPIMGIEFYYNAYIKKNSRDVGQSFSINFGLD
jgi:outer membrane protein assembly factor BamA